MFSLFEYYLDDREAPVFLHLVCNRSTVMMTMMVVIIMVVWQVEDSHIYCGLSDGRVIAFSLMVSDSGLRQSFDSSCVHDTSASRLRPVLSLAVTHGRVYYGDGSVNVKVIDCSQG